MKKKYCTYLLFCLLMIGIFSIRTYAATTPSLFITTNNYSKGDKMSLTDKTEISVNDTLQLYAVIATGNDMTLYDQERHEYTNDSLGWSINDNVSNSTTWISSNKNIATIDNNGKITAISKGNTTITANCTYQEQKYTKEYTITVIETKTNEDGKTENKEPTVSLKLGKSYSDSLEVIVNVNDLPESSSAKCEIYLIPTSGTAYQTGESYVIGTINDCKNGNNSYRISNLKENSKYTFQVVMNEKLASGTNNQVLGEKYMTFATIASSNVQNNNSVDTTGNTSTNPKTSTIAFIITISSAIISAISFILLYFKNIKRIQEI